MDFTVAETSPVDAVSIVIPAYNAGSTIGECLKSVTTLRWAGELEIIAVDDGSKDDTRAIASSFPGVRIIDLPHAGAARATNCGIKAASHDIVILLDADAVLEKDWLAKIMPGFANPSIAAIAGYAVTANHSITGRISGYDVEARLDRLPEETDHLYTMNTAYRCDVLLEVGLLNEGLGAGYDVDLSRRLRAAGYRLIFRKDVTCRHYWRDNLRGYLRQQYNYAYNRMELARRFGKPHDQLASLKMVLQVPFTVAVLIAAFLWSLSYPSGLFLLLLLPLSHVPRAFSLLARKKDVCMLLLPLLFTARNLCWLWGAIVWTTRRVGQGWIAWQSLLTGYRRQQVARLKSKIISR